MLDMRLVIQNFLLFTDLEDREGPRWKSLCEGAAEYIESRVPKRRRAEIPRHMERLCAAAAACAYGNYAALQAAARDNVRVGDISVGSSGAAEACAREVREHFLAQVADMLEPETVVFRQLA